MTVGRGFHSPRLPTAILIDALTVVALNWDVTMSRVDFIIIAALAVRVRACELTLPRVQPLLLVITIQNSSSSVKDY